MIASEVGPFLERGACDEWGNGPALEQAGAGPAPNSRRGASCLTLHYLFYGCSPVHPVVLTGCSCYGRIYITETFDDWCRTEDKVTGAVRYTANNPVTAALFKRARRRGHFPTRRKLLAREKALLAEHPPVRPQDWGPPRSLNGLSCNWPPRPAQCNRNTLDAFALSNRCA